MIKTGESVKHCDPFKLIIPPWNSPVPFISVIIPTLFPYKIPISSTKPTALLPACIVKVDW